MACVPPRPHAGGGLLPRKLSGRVVGRVLCAHCLTATARSTAAQPSAQAPGTQDAARGPQTFSAVFPSSARDLTSSHSHSLTIFPSRKTSTSRSSSSLPWPSASVVIAPVRSLTRVSRPFLDCLPLSVIGSLKTGTASPLMVASQHLKAHFCVSRLSFCSSAPPEPKAVFSAAHLCLAMFSRMAPIESWPTPSPWMMRTYEGRSLYPLGVVVVPNALPRSSSTSTTILGGSPESGRITSRPSLLSIIDLSSCPHSLLTAL
mmetsp:Transcript_7893/g.20222  ORF Transcript_7893/g.20222 Transcript_7893/m.20222 type:complete len:260 (-) Transcript_7893:916-1695(-)